METKIKEVQDYFKTELIAGRFEPVEFDLTFTVVNIIGFEFCIWNGEHGPQFCKPWRSIGRSFMELPEFTPTECEQLYVHLSKLINDNKHRIQADRIADLENQLAALKGGANGK